MKKPEQIPVMTDIQTIISSLTSARDHVAYVNFHFRLLNQKDVITNIDANATITQLTTIHQQLDAAISVLNEATEKIN